FNFNKQGIFEKKTGWLFSDFLQDQLGVSLIIKVTEDLKQGMTRTKECRLSFAGHNIRMVFDNEKKALSFKVNAKVDYVSWITQ
ncbi:MAG: hypothetical protein DRR16_24360, partial [Candidatus Parabeggiatoa sp. nov. 3]